MDSSNLSRRQFVGALAAAPLVGGSWPFLHLVPNGDARCLLVLELEGGNDGLGTVIPTEDRVLEKVRPRLLYVRKGCHDLGSAFALHPGMKELHRLFRDGDVAIHHGVGYDKPDRSHFRSRDIWHTADPSAPEVPAGATGWLGRLIDQLARGGAAIPGVSLGSLSVPLAMRARGVVVPGLQRVEDYRLLVSPGGREHVRREALQRIAQDDGARRTVSGGDDLRSFIGDVARSSIDNAERLRQALDSYRARASYPQTQLARGLQMAAKIVLCGFGTRVMHVRFGGFDTHASQQQAHDVLLSQLSAAISALIEDLRQHGKLDDFALLVHSEFGRRVSANSSGGTDHGTAGPVLLIGGGVKGGLHGRHPDTSRLVDGDLVHTTDFRAIYANLVRWMKVDEEKVLGARFPGAALI